MNEIDIARKMIQDGEDCARKIRPGFFEAYPDAYSDLGKRLQAMGQWNKYINGVISLPSAFAKLSGAPWTIGWGQTGDDIKQGTVWSQAQCDAALEKELIHIRGRIVGELLKRTATVNQLGAMIDLAYNIGLDIDEDTKAEGLGDSTLLKKFNAGDVQGAADAFMSWVYAGGVKSNGLIKRRQKGRAVFLGGAP